MILEKKKLFLILNFLWLLYGHVFATIEDYKMDNLWAKEILEKVALAKGDERKQLPAIQVYNPDLRNISDMAFYSQSSKTISLHPKLMEVCRSFGDRQDDALAFVIGHELTHFYQNVQEQHTIGFATIYYHAETDATKAKYLKEEEADIYGAFLAYLAGYKTLEIIPSIIEKLYTAFDLKNKKIAGSTMSERQATEKRICAAVDKIIKLHETGNYFFALGEYELSLLIFEQLLKYIETRELLNNAGVAAFSTALIAYPEQFNYKYPLEIDLSLSLPTRGQYPTANLLLDKAEYYFAKSTNFSSSYYTAHLNLASVYDAAGKYKKSKSQLNKLQPFLSKGSTYQFQYDILKGLEMVRANELDKAKEIFQSLSTKQNLPKKYKSVVLWNYQVLSGENAENIVNNNTPNLAVSMGDFDIFDDNNIDDKNQIWQVQMGDFSVNLFYNKQNTYEVMAISDGSGNFPVKIQKTNYLTSPYGNAIQQISNAFKKEKFSMTPHTFGVFYTFPNQGLIFNFNNDGGLIEWGIFLR